MNNMLNLFCDTCGHDAAECICPKCPECGEIGNEYCYEKGLLTYTTMQLIGRERRYIISLENQLSDAIEALHALEHKQETEDAKLIDRLAGESAAVLLDKKTWDCPYCGGISFEDDLRCACCHTERNYEDEL